MIKNERFVWVKQKSYWVRSTVPTFPDAQATPFFGVLNNIFSYGTNSSSLYYKYICSYTQ